VCVKLIGERPACGRAAEDRRLVGVEWQRRWTKKGTANLGPGGSTMRILVTGGAGYIGSHTVESLFSRRHAVFVYDNLSTGHRGAVPRDRLIEGDLGDISRLDQLFAENRIEAVLHFAAFAYVGESVRHPGKYYQNNLTNSLSLMELMRRHGVWRFVFSST